MIFDPRALKSHDPVLIGHSPVEQVSSCKYLGIQIDNVHLRGTFLLISGVAQRLHFLHRLRLFDVSTSVMLTFYDVILGSLIRYVMVAWFGSLSVQYKSKVDKMLKYVIKVISKKNDLSLQSVFEKLSPFRHKKMLKDSSHVLYSEYESLSSGRGFRANRFKSDRFKLSFLPTSVTLPNKQTAVTCSSMGIRVVSLLYIV